MTQTTPTRDEAPDVLAKQITAAASDMCEIARIADEWRNGPKQSLTAIREIRAVLASTPAPASGRVDAVLNLYREAVRVDVKMEGPQFMGANSSALKRAWEADRASLSPAATPANIANCCHCGRIIDTREKTEGGDDWGHQLSDQRWVCSPECLDAVADPAATPVSEAEPVERGDLIDGLDDLARRMPASADKLLLSEAIGLIQALAKPAGVAEIVAKMRSDMEKLGGFENGMLAVPADGIRSYIEQLEDALSKAASSPAGGDVVQTLIDKTEKLIEAADDMGWSCNSSSADQAIREAKDAVRAALSQSTSAGRGDGDAGS